MKLKMIGALLLLFTPVLVFATSVSAQTFRTSDQTAVVAGDESIDGSAWVTGSTVNVSGKIDGDLFCAGQNVTVSGDVTGDVICAGQTVTISGNVSGDLRVAGQTVLISGKIDQNASVIGQSVTVDSEATIGSDASFATQDVTINGTIGRDLAIASAGATLNSSIGRDVTATVETLNINNDAKIAGTVDYTGPSEATVASSAVIEGELNYTKAEKPASSSPSNSMGMSLGGAFFFVFVTVACALAFALIFPGLLRRATDKSVASFGRVLLNILVGLVAGIVMPFVIFLLLISVVGIPIAIIVMLAWLLIVLVSGAFTAFYVGRAVLQHQTSNIPLMMLVGSLFIGLLLLLPFVNFFVLLLAVWYGVGTILMHLKDTFDAPQYEIGETKSSKRSTQKA